VAIDQQRPTVSDRDQLVDESNAVDYLAERGIVDAATAHAVALGGGVSNVVVAVNDNVRHVVLKQALRRLRVAEEWTADPNRVLTEADALEYAGTLNPGLVPRVLARDPEAHLIVLDRAPADWVDWKSRLLQGRVDPTIAGRLGDVLAQWRTASALGRDLPARLEDPTGFEQLRIDPYYLALGRAEPELAPVTTEMAEQLRSHRSCFVHGDFSPKNVLVGAAAEQLWVIDFEVAHRGDPAFDIAFLLTHFTLKAVHRPESASAYDACTSAFAERYHAGVSSSLATDWSYILRHVACLLLARVRGKSPAEYLDDAQRERAWRVGLDLLSTSPSDPAALSERRNRVLGV
jgi:5-methylthioribose kinase